MSSIAVMSHVCEVPATMLTGKYASKPNDISSEKGVSEVASAR